MLEVARGRVPEGVGLKQGVAEALPFKDGWFERSVTQLSLHLWDRPRAFAELQARRHGPRGDGDVRPEPLRRLLAERVLPVDRADRPGPLPGRRDARARAARRRASRSRGSSGSASGRRSRARRRWRRSAAATSRPSTCSARTRSPKAPPGPSASCPSASPTGSSGSSPSRPDAPSPPARRAPRSPRGYETVDGDLVGPIRFHARLSLIRPPSTWSTMVAMRCPMRLARGVLAWSVSAEAVVRPIRPSWSTADLAAAGGPSSRGSGRAEWFLGVALDRPAALEPDRGARAPSPSRLRAASSSGRLPRREAGRASSSPPRSGGSARTRSRRPSCAVPLSNPERRAEADREVRPGPSSGARRTGARQPAGAACSSLDRSLPCRGRIGLVEPADVRDLAPRAVSSAASGFKLGVRRRGPGGVGYGTTVQFVVCALITLEVLHQPASGPCPPAPGRDRPARRAAPPRRRSARMPLPERRNALATIATIERRVCMSRGSRFDPFDVILSTKGRRGRMCAHRSHGRSSWIAPARRPDPAMLRRFAGDARGGRAAARSARLAVLRCRRSISWFAEPVTLGVHTAFNPVQRGRKGVACNALPRLGRASPARRRALERTLSRIAHEIIERNADLDQVALVGIHTRGVPLAQRLRRLIEEFAGAELALGTVDITFYRDDVHVRGGEAPLHPQPLVRATKLDFPLEGRTVHPRRRRPLHGPHDPRRDRGALRLRPARARPARRARRPRPPRAADPPRLRRQEPADRAATSACRCSSSRSTRSTASCSSRSRGGDADDRHPRRRRRACSRRGPPPRRHLLSIARPDARRRRAAARAPRAASSGRSSAR